MKEQRLSALVFLTLRKFSFVTFSFIVFSCILLYGHACAPGKTGKVGAGDTDCDKKCVDKWLDSYANCYNGYIDCVSGGGDLNQCFEDAINCINAAWDKKCECSYDCHSCIKILCNCIDDCPAENQGCVDSCWNHFYDDCAYWMDEDCATNCDSQFTSCFNSCMQAQGYQACRECVTSYVDCYKGCY